MSDDIRPGVWVRLFRPERGYSIAEIVEYDGVRHQWILRTTSGYEFAAYSDEFEIDH